MYYYRIADVTLQSVHRLMCFGEFACEAAKADVILEDTTETPPPGEGYCSGTIIHLKTDGGWYFYPGSDKQKGLFISEDYTHLRLRGNQGDLISGAPEWFVRIAIECILIRRGYVSLHSAAVEVDGEAFAFTGPSGMGKSTRAQAWIDGMDAKLINGDRPLINVRQLDLYGVPWDGKEQCFRNVQYPLKAICEVRRFETSVYVREMSFSQRRKVLMQQCFIPMWDTETAAIQIANISKLAAKANILRVFCGPTTEDALALYNAIQEGNILKEEKDMKANPGFILRNVVDEFILMPTGDNIGKFNGTVLLNEVSALVWEKLQNPVSRDDLLKAILDEFEVEKAVAAADLDALLAKLKEYGVISED